MTHGEEKKIKYPSHFQKKERAFIQQFNQFKNVISQIKFGKFSLADFKVNSFWVSNVSCRIYD